MLAQALLAAALLAVSASAAVDVPSVLMDEYIIAQASDHPVVRTAGVATCIAVTLYDPFVKIGALAHISAMTSIAPSLAAIKRDMVARGARGVDLRAQVIGGWRTTADGPMGFTSTSPKMLAEILAALSRGGIPVIRQETLVEPGMKAGAPSAIRNLEFDLRTGLLKDFEPGAGLPGRVIVSAPLLAPHPLSL